MGIGRNKVLWSWLGQTRSAAPAMWAFLFYSLPAISVIRGLAKTLLGIVKDILIFSALYYSA